MKGTYHFKSLGHNLRFTKILKSCEHLYARLIYSCLVIWIFSYERTFLILFSKQDRRTDMTDWGNLFKKLELTARRMSSITEMKRHFTVVVDPSMPRFSLCYISHSKGFSEIISSGLNQFSPPYLKSFRLK